MARHMWSYSMLKKYGQGADSDYPLPPFPCLEDTVTERIEHHFNVHEWSFPAEYYTPSVGAFKRFSNRRLDSR